MRLKTDIKQKEATFQVVPDALALTPFYRAFLISADVPAIYMQEFWAIVFIHKSSIRFTINKKKVFVDVDMFREILWFCPKFPRQKFEDVPLEHDILSFIRDLGNSRDIIYLTNVNVDYLHQPWRAFATVMNNAYMTYYAFASKEKASKPKYVRKKADFNVSPKKKRVQATKGTRIKTKAKVAKHDKKKQPIMKPKAKGLAVLSDVALTEAEQLKLATKKSKTDFHISHASGSGVPDVPIYVSESDKESWGDSDEEDDDKDYIEDDANNNDDDNGGSEDHDDDKENVNERVHTRSDYELTDDEKIHNEENTNEEEEDEVTKELYDDVNVNLGNEDTEITNADQRASEQQNSSQRSGFEQEEEDAHLTLTPVLNAQKIRGPTQSSLVFSDFTRKLLNLNNPTPADNEIASLVDTIAYHATTIP
nr:hypothetical protein [Tanacetum cinerariifolium]